MDSLSATTCGRLITSDYDLVPGDHQLTRVSVVDAFRQGGIYPRDVKNLSVGSLIWNPPENSSLKLDMSRFRDILGIGSGNLNLDRGTMYQHQRRVQGELHDWMRDLFIDTPALAREWGLDVSSTAPLSIQRDKRKPGLPKFEVHSVRRCRRIGPDDQERVDILIEVMQRRVCYLNDADQQAADAGKRRRIARRITTSAARTLIVDPRPAGSATPSGNR